MALKNEGRLEANRLLLAFWRLDLGGLASFIIRAGSKFAPPLFVALDPLDGSSLMDSSLSAISILESTALVPKIS